MRCEMNRENSRRRRPPWTPRAVLSPILTACVLIGACGSHERGSPEPSSSARPQEGPRAAAPRAVVLPDVSRLAEPVQRQLRDRFADLTQKLSRRATPAPELAGAYGDLGRLLLAA